MCSTYRKFIFDPLCICILLSKKILFLKCKKIRNIYLAEKIDNFYDLCKNDKKKCPTHFKMYLQ
jgi:hypothetical protein